MAKESLSRRDFMKGAAALGVMAAGSVLGLKSASAETIPAEFVPGTYTATAMGFGGDVTVSITVDETKILGATITADGETASIGQVAAAQLARGVALLCADFSG